MTIPPPLDWDPGDLGDDPDATTDLLRAGGPVRPLTNGFWVVTGHAEVLDVLRHPAMSSGPIAALYTSILPPGAARDEMSHRINFLDPPDHPRVRSLVAMAFTPRRVTAMRPWMEATADRLVEEAAGSSPDGTVDLLHDVAHQLPSLVISELLGVPTADRDRLTALADAVAPLLSVRIDPGALEPAVAAAEELHAYLGALVDERIERGGDDLLAALVRAEQDGERLSRPELLSLAATLYSAGHRTTRDLFANGVALLLEAPERWDRVATGRWPVPATVAELVRLATPTLYVSRVASGPATVGGAEVPAGAPVLAFLRAANRDPAAYEDPSELRPGREGPPPLSFAFGAHHCLGASLARSELEVLLAATARRWPRLRLAGGPVRWHQRGPFRGPDSLVVAPA